MTDNHDLLSVRRAERRRRSWLWVWGPTVAWMLAILIGTSIPESGRPGRRGGDKAQHFLAYAALTILAHRSWRFTRTSGQPRLGLAAVTLLTAGGWALLDELHQIPIPTREFQLLDLTADAAGILVGLLLMAYWPGCRRLGGLMALSNNRRQYPMANVREISAEEFDTEVLESDQPYLIDLWAPWCGPCRMVAPVVEAIAEKYAGRIKVGKLNVDDAPDVASRYGVRSIPSLFIFKDGELVERAVGVQPEEQLAALVERVL